MKKILITTLVFTLSFSLVGAAVAAPKIQKTICLLWPPSIAVSVLSIKPHGRPITVSGGKIKYYAIHGEVTNNFDYALPVAGTGHMDGDIFHFSFGGSAGFGGSSTAYTFEGSWNIVTQTGTGSYIQIDPIGGILPNITTLELVDCSLQVVPYVKDQELTKERVDPFLP